ncbi:MAG: Cu(I)-responsive transcriptional regulator [Roseateles sp.]
MSRLLNISQAAAEAGVSAKMIRHYEQIGLISPAVRTEAGYRQYSDRDVSIQRFIRQARLLGFSMAQIAELLSLWTNRERSSREVKALALGHLQTIEGKLREMQEMQAQLQRLVAACHGDDHPDCAILDELAVHSAVAPERAPPAVKAKATACAKASDGCQVQPADAPGHLGLTAWARSIGPQAADAENPAH